jgi:hypothetical protein
MMRRNHRTAIRALTAAALLLALAPHATAAVSAPGAVGRPDGRGDQVIAYYDARDGFTTFINLRNESSAAVSVKVLLYDATFAQSFTKTITIDAFNVTTIDVGGLRGEGLSPSAGIAFATTVNASGAPIVSRALAGNFSIANLATSSAWGAPALARSAVEPSARKPPPAPSPPPLALATVIDGSDILLPPIQAGNADLATYYDPDFVARSGGSNQLIFVAFEDVPGATYTAQAGQVAWTVQAVNKHGEQVGLATFNVSGVVVSDIASVVGADANGSAGGIVFIAPGTTKPVTRLIFFTESLGPFTTGYLLPRAGRS